MRIAISGAANTGKSTLMSSFLSKWSSYETPEKTYRDLIKEKNLKHSSKTTAETQTVILDSLFEQQKGYSKLEDKVVYDRCPLDALAYTMWCYGKGVNGIDSDFVQTQISIVKETIKLLDLIFICKFDSTQHIVDDGSRDADLEYIREIDNIFESLYQQYFQNVHADVFFPKDDSPAIIKLPDSLQERMDLIGEYVTPDGNMYGEEESVLNPDNLEELERLVQQQQLFKEAEEKDKELFGKFGSTGGL